MGCVGVRELACSERFRVRDARCRSPRPEWTGPEVAVAYEIVLVRAGCFRRRVGGAETLVDPTVVYLRQPGEEQRVAHVDGVGDACTSVHVDAQTLAEAWGGDLSDLPSFVFSTPAVDLAHRRLLRACGEGTDAFEVEERLDRLVSGILATCAPARTGSGGPATAALRRRLVADARERLSAEPWRGAAALARDLAVSPHHLSRTFSAVTGHTLTRYRNRVRVRLALERLAEGEPSLAALAAELGFADHAHLTRTVRRETGHAPSELRRQVRVAATRHR